MKKRVNKNNILMFIAIFIFLFVIFTFAFSFISSYFNFENKIYQKDIDKKLDKFNAELANIIGEPINNNDISNIILDGSFWCKGADGDKDGKVWISDWGLLRANFGNYCPDFGKCPGDFDNDGRIWLSDWGILRAYFGFTGCYGYCGDEIIKDNEQCDDGNDDNTDFCSNDCKLTICGDNSVQRPNSKNQLEECDGDDECDKTCKYDSILKNTGYGYGVPQECKTCSDCGNGLFNFCDKEECENLGDSCTFINGIPGTCEPNTQCKCSCLSSRTGLDYSEDNCNNNYNSPDIVITREPTDYDNPADGITLQPLTEDDFIEVSNKDEELMIDEIPYIEENKKLEYIADTTNNEITKYYKVKKGEYHSITINIPNDKKYLYNVEMLTDGDLKLSNNIFINPVKTLFLPNEETTFNIVLSGKNSKKNPLKGRIIIKFDRDMSFQMNIRSQIMILNLEQFGLDEKDARFAEIENELAQLAIEEQKIPPEEIKFPKYKIINLVIMIIDEDGCRSSTIQRINNQKEITKSIRLHASTSEDLYAELNAEHNKDEIEVEFSENKPIVPKGTKKEITYTIKFKDKKPGVDLGGLLSELISENSEENCDESEEAKKQAEENEVLSDIELKISAKDIAHNKIFECLKFTIEQSCCIPEGSKTDNECKALFGDNYEQCGPVKNSLGLPCCYESDINNPLSGGCNIETPKFGGTQYICCKPGERKQIYESIVGKVPICSPVEDTCSKQGKKLCKTPDNNQVDICCPLYEGDGRDICMYYNGAGLSKGTQTPSCGKLQCNSQTETQCPTPPKPNPFIPAEGETATNPVLCCNNQYEKCIISAWPPFYPLPLCVAKTPNDPGYEEKPGHFVCQGAGQFSAISRWCEKDKQTCYNHPSPFNGVPICMENLV